MEISEIAKGSKNILLPYQIRWMADGSLVKIAEKSRRVGITWSEAADSALSAAARRGMDTWYLGYNKDMALEFVETASQWARQFNKAAHEIEEVAIDDEKRDILAYRIRFSSGHKIVALSSRPSNLRGKQGRAIIDEAAFHDDLQGLLKAALAFTMWGGAVRVISTHNGAANPFNQLVNEVRAGRLPYSLHRITIDDAMADGLYHRICEKLGRKWSSADEAQWRAELFAEYGDAADEELCCIPRASGGSFLSSLLVEARMRADAAVVRWEMPESFASRSEDQRVAETRDWCEQRLAPLLAAMDSSAMTFFGEDFGRSGDLTVIWPLQMKANLVRRTPFVVEMRNIPFRQQEQVLFFLADRMPRFQAGAMDARGNGQFLAETAMQRYGRRIKQVMLTNDWYRENMPRYKAAFEDGKIELPRDAEILADHRMLVMENGVARVPERHLRMAGGKLRHGDSAIAAVLAYYASSLDVPQIAYTPARATAAERGRESLREDEDNPLRRSGGRLRTIAGSW